MTTKKKYIIGALATIAVLAGVAKYKSWFGKEKLIEVTTETASKRSITELVSASGKIQPETEVKISPDVSGEIIELYVKEGQYVHSGDLLFKIKPDLYETTVSRADASVNASTASLQSAQARLEQSNAQFENIKASYTRNQKLFDQGVLSPAEFDNAKAQYEASKADLAALTAMVNNSRYNINSSKATLKEANDNLKRTLIYAPVSGTVSKLSVKKGERVVGTSQMAGTEIMRIANLSLMEVQADINENDIVKINVNDSATIEIDAYPNQKFRGVVTQIANAANSVAVSADAVTNYSVKIRILAESYKNLVNNKPTDYSPFRPSMSASVDINTNKVNDVISVPLQSITTREDTAITAKKQVGDDTKNTLQTYLFVVVGDSVVLRKVAVGIQDNDYIQVLNGVITKEKIVSGPYSAISKDLKQGTKVKLVTKEELYNTMNNHK
ncbi:MAG: efflux RND transporter periplasmic adaptor subunit [Bacteroidia bacterium]|nr:efflux RND transporter periplasmic adaptor subunit [Bacteroidia bacterium]